MNTWSDEVLNLAKKLGFEELDTRTHQLLRDFRRDLDDIPEDAEDLYERFLNFEENYYSPDLLFDNEIDFKQLSVQHVMDSKILSLPPDYPVRELASSMLRNMLRGVPVVDKDNKLLGVISQGDIVGLVARGIDPERVVVSDIMCRYPVTVYSNSNILLAIHKMLGNRLHRIIVVNKEFQLEGIITSLDLCHILRKFLRKTLRA